MSHKRSAEGQLTRDDDGDSRADEEFVTTPQIADASEMSTRRVVKVRRPEGTTAAPSAFATGSSSGFFKDAAAAASSAAPTKPTFGFNFGTGNSSGATAVPATFSFGTPSADGATKSATAGFSFGLPSSTTTTSTSTETPSSKESKPLFGFPTTTATAGDAKPAFAFPSPSGSAAPSTAEGEKSGSAVKPLTFNFGAAPSATEETAKKVATPFSFGFSTPTTTTTTNAAPASADGGAVAEAPKPVFGAGTFNFSSAVNSFVAARTKMQADAKDEGGATTAEAKGADTTNNNNNNDDDDDDTPDPAGFGSEVVEPTARDVLAAAPSKLYVFEKGEEGKAGRWAERGTGDAKLISQPKADNAEEHVYRLLVRSGYSLNATIKRNTFTLSKTEAKHLILLVATAEGPQTYLLKFTGPTAEANTAKFAEALAKVVEEVSKAE